MANCEDVLACWEAIFLYRLFQKAECRHYVIVWHGILILADCNIGGIDCWFDGMSVISKRLPVRLSSFVQQFSWLHDVDAVRCRLYLSQTCGLPSSAREVTVAPEWFLKLVKSVLCCLVLDLIWFSYFFLSLSFFPNPYSSSLLLCVCLFASIVLFLFFSVFVVCFHFCACFIFGISIYSSYLPLTLLFFSCSFFLPFAQNILFIIYTPFLCSFFIIRLISLFPVWLSFKLLISSGEFLDDYLSRALIHGFVC